jgi:hypothetical protein
MNLESPQNLNKENKKEQDFLEFSRDIYDEIQNRNKDGLQGCLTEDFFKLDSSVVEVATKHSFPLLDKDYFSNSNDSNVVLVRGSMDKKGEVSSEHFMLVFKEGNEVKKMIIDDKYLAHALIKGVEHLEK